MRHILIAAFCFLICGCQATSHTEATRLSVPKYPMYPVGTKECPIHHVPTGRGERIAMVVGGGYCETTEYSSCRECMREWHLKVQEYEAKKRASNQ